MTRGDCSRLGAIPLLVFVFVAPQASAMYLKNVNGISFRYWRWR